MRRRLLFSLVLVIALFAVVEVGLRLADLRHGRSFFDHQPAVAGQLVYVRHPFLGTTLRPDQRMQSLAGPVTVNADGFRGPRVPLAKPPGVRRVACLGGSATFGTGAGDDDTYPARMRLAFEAAAPERWQVVNAGVPGFSSAEMLILFALKVADWRPDYAVFYEAYNDLKMVLPDFASDYSHAKSFAAPRSLLAEVAGRSKTYRWIRHKLLLQTPMQTFLQQTGGKAGATADAETTFRRNVTHFVALADGIGARPVLVSYAMPLGEETLAARPDIRASVAAFIPSLTLDGVRAGLARYNALLRDVAAEHGVPFVDAVALLAGDPANFVDHCHLSPQGAERLGQALATRILALEPAPMLATP